MITLEEVGGIRVVGRDAEAWGELCGRKIQGIDVEFTDDVTDPCVRAMIFTFPTCKDVTKAYTVALMGIDGAVIMRAHTFYRCTCFDGVPKVVMYHAISRP